MIEEVSIPDLDPRLIKQLEAADKALNRDLSYSLDIYSAILQQQPGCLELRKKLRAKQLQASGNQSSGVGSLFNKLTNVSYFIRGRSKKSPEELLQSAEELISKNPLNVTAHQMLADAADSLNLTQTKVFAYETIRKIHPKDLTNLKMLANAYLEAGLSDQAIEIGNAILEINPSDGDAEDMMKRASVAVAMNKGKWEGSKDFRDQLKDQAETEALEQASKTVNDSKSLESLIRSTYDQIQAEPQNLSLYRQLSDYYHRYGDHQNAIAWINQARQLDAGKGDVSLEEKERSLTLEYYDDIIEKWEKASANDPQNKETSKGLKDAILARKAYQRAQLESLVKRYPNELGYRFDLGVLLFDEKEFDACLPHFQLAQRNAKSKLSAILYLGRAYRLKKFYDLAIEQFSLLKAEIQIMDDRKKEAVYELGCCYESMGKTEHAIEEFKAIYSADISFRDVADKINEFYSK